jgi:hypothetical protein
MTHAATVRHRDTERPLHPFTARRRLSHHMAVADGVGTTNRNFLLKGESTLNSTIVSLQDIHPLTETTGASFRPLHTPKTTTGLLRDPRGIITPAKRTLLLMHRLGRLPNIPPGRTVVATEASLSAAASSMVAGEGPEAASRARSGTLRAIITVELLLPRARNQLTPPPISLPTAMPKTRRRRAIP